MKDSLILFFLLCFSSSMSHAQLGLPQAREGSVRPFNEYVLSDWVLKNHNPYKDIDGSPFLNDQWVMGEIRTIHDQRFQEVSLKLNLYEGQLMHLNRFTGDSSLINYDLLWSFSLMLDDSVYLFEKFELIKKNEKLAGFYIVLLPGENTLLARPKINLRRATDNSLVNSTGKLKDRFVTSNEFYIQLPDKSLTRLRNNKKSMQLVFGAHYKACKDFVSEMKMDWNDPEDVRRVVAFFHEISNN